MTIGGAIVFVDAVTGGDEGTPGGDGSGDLAGAGTGAAAPLPDVSGDAEYLRRQLGPNKGSPGGGGGGKPGGETDAFGTIDFQIAISGHK